MFNMFQIGVEIKGQWPYTKPGEKIRINESLHPPGWFSPGRWTMPSRLLPPACCRGSRNADSA